jgi:hypothetical protein
MGRQSSHCRTSGPTISKALIMILVALISAACFLDVGTLFRQLIAS